MGRKMKLLDDDDDNDQRPTDGRGFKINSAYAERYDNWRRLEEMQKFKSKYGNDAVDDEESSSESEPEWTVDHEKEFLRTLGALKGHSNKVYEEGTRFFKDAEIGTRPTKPKKDNKLLLRDYERKVVLERNGEFDEEDYADMKPETSGYFEEQEKIKRRLHATISAMSDDEDADLLVKREKTEAEQQKEDEEYIEWLKNNKDIKGEAAEELKSLKTAWNDPNLDENERFLRDYLLNKEYEVGDNEEIPTYEEICALDEEEQEFKRQEDYETKYNMIHEEPDEDFIKQYPRTVAESIRKKSTKRSEQREAVRDRKRREKEEKAKEFEQLKSMKKDEINKKLKRLQKLAGDNIPVNIDDLEKDFDPAEYDRRMQELFNDRYYEKEEEPTDADGKPIFSDLSEDEFDDSEESDDPDAVELGTLKKLNGVKSKRDDAKEFEEEGESQFRGRLEPSNRRRKRNSRFSEAVSREKPLFDPNEKTFEQYFNEYYALDYEDIIGNQRTRFKYRSVQANDFGLSVEEILGADDRQLNAWASVKKATAYKTDADEAFDVAAYKRKAQNVEKKKRILEMDFGGKKSQKLVVNAQKEDAKLQERIETTEKLYNSADATKKEKRTKKVKKIDQNEDTHDISNDASVPEKSQHSPVKSEQLTEGRVKKTRNRKRKHKNAAPSSVQEMSDDRLKAYGLNPKKFKNKLKYSKKPKLEAA